MISAVTMARISKNQGLDMKAFPVSEEAYINDEEGMDFRDYFAAKAMQSIVSGIMDHVDIGFTESQVGQVCVDSYTIADAMMEARK